MNDWLSTALDLIARNQPAVLVSVIGTQGSAPRDSGTRMLVCTDDCHGTIGGGHLEYKAIALAREQLASGNDSTSAEPCLRRFPLGASLGQCCGGLVHLLFEPLNRETGEWLYYLRRQHDAGQPVVMVTDAVTDAGDKSRVIGIRKLLVSESDYHGELIDAQQATLLAARQYLHDDNERDDRHDHTRWFEKLLPDDFRVLIFGAGHVGKALIRVLSSLPCHITWVDSRPEQFPTALPANVSGIVSEEPEMELATAASGSYVLILTHNHALDESICAQALQNPALAWCGLIGSATKRRKFIHRFQARGMSDATIARLTCPIGLPGFTGKHPGEIAVSVAAQILDVRQKQLAGRAVTDSARTQLEFA